MDSGKAKDIWRFGVSFVMLCIASMPLLAAAGTPPGGLPPTSPNTGYLAPGETTRTPDYYTTANWANSPPLAKFVDTLPGLGAANANNLGQYLSVGKPDIVSYPGSDYYEIHLVEYRERMHSDLPATTGPTTGATTGTLLRGYVQVNKGTDTSVCGGAAQPACSAIHNTLVPDPVKQLGPTLVAQRDRPVRIKFTNRLPVGPDGDLFIPTDLSVMGAGTGPASPGAARGQGTPCDNTIEPNSCASYTQNRSAIHLHGGRTPWISDGTPHQWITPVEEITPFTKGVSFANVPDMPDPGDGSMTYYYTNQQSARLMFYHEHAFGITRLNPYIGVAAGYLITDEWEQDLVTRGILPADQIPLIIQDKTFVDARVTTKKVYNSVTGLFETPVTAPHIRHTDPLWNWGSGVPDAAGVRPPVTGDLWLPHVYMPAQTLAAGFGGVNPFGRWMYGPWFYPATNIPKGPVPNPYYDADCSSPIPAVYANCTTPGQPTMIPGTPNVSMGMEAFQDSAVVNGTAFPSLTVDPRAYRFRILNAASDRFQNLSFYVADPTPAPADPRRASNLTEVKMVPASASLALAGNWPPDWPVDGRDGGVPDPGTCTNSGTTAAPNWNCTNWGPKWFQIGTEGGFLPQPDLRDPQPVTYITDPTAFWVGIVDKTGLSLGPAERADAIVDFSAYAGKTLILYNDAPAAWPARVAGYDYFTGAPDMRESGGYGAGGVYDIATGTWIADPTNPSDVPHGVLPGFAPNTRTVMQVIVRPSGSTNSYNQANLENEFKSTAPATALNPIIPGSNPPRAKTLFERAQEPIIVGQAAYSETYPGSYFPPNFPWQGISQINDQSINFVTLTGQAVTAPMHPKGIHDEMGASFDPVYGRMSGNLAMQLPNPTTLNALLVLYGFSDLPTETINNSTTVNVEVLGAPKNDDFLYDPANANLRFTTNLGDGTQLWKISHNGVDTHPIHFHIFDVQLVNRVGWDGQIALPEPNELGWKDTIKISPLMDTIVAVRPRAPALPFGIANSMRPLNPAIPIGSPMGFNSVDWKTGQTRIPAVTNILYDFKWEYVWHCHILSHEEMDMMRPIVLNVTNAVPNAPVLTGTAFSGSSVNLTWVDPTPAATSLGNIANEVGFGVYRCEGLLCTDFALIDRALANATSYSDFAISPSINYRYQVIAFNAAGDSLPSAIGTATSGANIAPTVAITTPVTGASYFFGEAIILDATATVPNGDTIANVEFFDGATLLATDTTAPYSFTWTNAAVGAHSISAVVNPGIAAPVISTAMTIMVINPTPPTITTASLPNGAVNAAYNRPIAISGGIAPYTWAATGLPAGLSINPGTGVISGTPANVVPSNAAFANFTVSITVTDSTATTANKVLNLRINQTAPAAPSGLAATRPAANRAVLTWNDNANNELGVQVQRAIDAAFTTGLSSAWVPGVNLTTYTDTTVVGATPYFYRIRSGNFVAWSTTFSNTTVAPTAAALTITTTSLVNGAVNSAYNRTVAATGGTVPYTWAATGLPTGLSINPGTGVISGTPANVVPSNATFANFAVSITVTDSTATTANKVLNLRINQTAPAAPSALAATSPLPNRVVLTWTDNANNELGVQVQRATDAAFTTGLSSIWVPGVNLTTYTDTTVVGATPYFYRIRSGNFVAWSTTFSNVVPVTTP